MDKIYKVFVSSTFEDLREERQEVLKALLALHCFPVGMELFSASNDDQWTHIKKEIDDCDYYILIIGERYGTINMDDKSYTEMEYDYALKLGIPIIAFLPDEHYKMPKKEIPEPDADNQKKLNLFKKHVKHKLVKFWKNPDDLKYKVSQSLANLIKETPANGWIKNAVPADPSSCKKENESLKDQIYELNHEIERLNSKIDILSAKSRNELDILLKNAESIALSFAFNIYSERGSGNAYATTKVKKFNITWKDIFKHIAPDMTQKCSENDIRDNLKNLIQQDKFKSAHFRYKNISDYYITNKSYNIIITKFKNLGLIALSNRRKRNSNDHTIYWKLTPYGDEVMTQLLST